MPNYEINQGFHHINGKEYAMYIQMKMLIRSKNDEILPFAKWQNGSDWEGHVHWNKPDRKIPHVPSYLWDL